MLYVKAMNLQWLLLQKYNLVEQTEKKILKANNKTYANISKHLTTEQQQHPIYSFRSPEIMIKPAQLIEILQNDPQNMVFYYEYIYEMIKYKIKQNDYYEVITWSEIIFSQIKENTGSLWHTKMSFLVTLIMPNVYMNLYNKKLEIYGVKTEIPLYQTNQLKTVIANTGMKSRKEYYKFKTLLFSIFDLFKQLNKQGLVAYAEMYIEALSLYLKIFDQIKISKYDRITIRQELKKLGKNFLPRSTIISRIQKIINQFENEYEEERNYIDTTLVNIKQMIIEQELTWNITQVDDLLHYDLNTLEKSIKERLLFEALLNKQSQLDGLINIPSKSWKQILQEAYDELPTSTYSNLEKGMITFFLSLWGYHDMLEQHPSIELRKKQQLIECLN